MKILIITTQIPYPPYRGDRLKIFNVCKVLMRNNTVKVLAFMRHQADIGNINELKKKHFDIQVIKLPYIKSIFNLWRSLLFSIPFEVSAFYSQEMKRKISKITLEEKFDVIYFHLINTAPYYDSVADPTALKVIDFTDAMSLYLTRYLDYTKNYLKKIIYYFELRQMMKYEKVVRPFDTLFVCSDADKVFLENRNIHNNLRVLPNGFDIETFSYVKMIHEKNRILFVGNMPYYPNIDAVLYFVKDIFPLVLRKAPDARFHIVGQNPPKQILSLQSEKIIVTGFVSDIRKEYLLSTVNVSPLRIGAGTPNKIIESLALGVPTISTSVAVKGFPKELKKFIFTADTPEVFAEYVVKLLNDNSIRDNLLKEGRMAISDKLSWDNVIKELESYLSRRINK